MINHRTVSIVGAGPAGLSASIQLNRFGISHFVFEKSAPGGLLRNGNLISNYAAIHPPVAGKVLADMMIEHFNGFSQEVVRSNVDRVEYDDSADKFSVSAGGSLFTSDFVITATGTKPVRPEILKNLTAGLLKYVRFDVIGMEGIKNQRVLVVGGGDCAFDYALTLSSHNDVEIINRTDRIKALQCLRDKISSTDRIKVRIGTELGEITGGGNRPLKTVIVKSGEKTVEEFDGIVFAAGRVPDTACISGLGKNRQDSLIKKGRLYLAGDLVRGKHRQALIAAGDGLAAAMKINDMIEGYRNDERRL